MFAAICYCYRSYVDDDSIKLDPAKNSRLVGIWLVATFWQDFFIARWLEDILRV